MSLHKLDKCTLRLVALFSLFIAGGCGGNGSNPTAPVQASNLVRVEIAQTLIQSTEDPHLVIAQQKPLLVRAFFTVPDGLLPPSKFLVNVSTAQHPDAASIAMNCPASFPATFPSDPTAAQTANATGVCKVILSQASDGSWWSAPGLSLTFHALNAAGKDVMTPVRKNVESSVLAKNLTIPLCPRIIVDAHGASLNSSMVGNLADMHNAVLAYFPFSNVSYCPDAFTPLSVVDLSAYGDASVAGLTQAQIEENAGLILTTLENYRAARKDGFSGYIHVGLLESSLIFVNPPSNDQAYRGTHGVTRSIGGLTIALFVPPSFALGPIDYFQYHLIFLHELGHALGLAHAPGCGAAAYDPGFPYIDGALPQNADDPPVTPIGTAVGTPATVPLRGTIGNIDGYQLEPLSNTFSSSYPGPAARNDSGYFYQAGNHQLIGNGPNELPISAFQTVDLNKTQVYDLMNYCSAYFYNKWISDYSYLRIASFSLDRIQADGSFSDLSGKVTFGNVPPPNDVE